jgi:hypothetical protein
MPSERVGVAGVPLHEVKVALAQDDHHQEDHRLCHLEFERYFVSVRARVRSCACACVRVRVRACACVRALQGPYLDESDSGDFDHE